MRLGPVVRPVLSLVFFTSGLLFTGCGAGPSVSTAAPLAYGGRVFGGQQPIAQSRVTVWQAGLTGYGSAATELAHVTTDSNGNFAFPANAYVCPAPDTQVYITASGGYAAPTFSNPNVLLAAGLGDCSSAKNQFVVINEVTTVATAFALKNYFSNLATGAPGDSFGTSVAGVPYFRIANRTTIGQLVDLPSGQARGSEQGVTREPDRLNTMANILAACVNDSADFGHCQSLFQLLTVPAAAFTPTNTLEAAAAMAYWPKQSVTDLYSLVQGTGAPFVGSRVAPTDWTLAIAYSSPAFGLSITPALPSGGGTSFDISSTGLVWFPSNASGKTGAGTFDASTATFGPLLLPNQMVSPQYLMLSPSNVAVMPDTATNQYGLMLGGSSVLQSVSGATSFGPVQVVDGTPMVAYMRGTIPSLGLIQISTMETLADLDQPATAIAVGTSGLFVLTSGLNTPCRLEQVGQTAPHYHLDLIVTGDQNCQSGGLSFTADGKPFGLTTSPAGICAGVPLQPSSSACFATPDLIAPVGLARDEGVDSWVADSGGHAVGNGFSAAGVYVHPETLPRPYGLAIDGAGNVWLTNAGCVSTTTTRCSPGDFVLTEIVGVALPALTPLSAQAYGATPQVIRSRPSSPSFSSTEKR